MWGWGLLWWLMFLDRLVDDKEIIILLIQMNQKRVQLSSSALTNHYLQSILPFQTIPPCQQFSKTKQFYKPQQFIWNNPHRTSKRMYPYYHQANDNYQKNVKPVIEQIVQDDRIRNQEDRIRRLSHVREETRNRFHSRQQMRLLVQTQTGVRRKEHSNRTLNHSEQEINNSTFILSRPSKMHIKLENQNSQFSRVQSSKLSNRKNTIQKSRTEQGYASGVQAYDMQMQKIKKMCTQQMLQKHNKIRYQFKSRKQANQIVNSRIKNLSLLQN